MANVAQELAKGGAYAAWLLVTIEAGVIVFLYKEHIKTLKEDSQDAADTLTKINQTQAENSMALSMILRILESIQSAFMNGGQK